MSLTNTDSPLPTPSSLVSVWGSWVGWVLNTHTLIFHEGTHSPREAIRQLVLIGLMDPLPFEAMQTFCLLYFGETRKKKKSILRFPSRKPESKHPPSTPASYLSQGLWRQYRVESRNNSSALGVGNSASSHLSCSADVLCPGTSRFGSLSW